MCVIRKFQRNDFSQINSWPMEQWVDRSETWVDYVLSNPCSYCFSLFRDQTIVAYVSFDVSGTQAFFAIEVNPTERHKGYGTKLLTETIQIAKKMGVNELVASVALRNEISQQFCAKNGLLPISQHDGFLCYKKCLAP